MTIDSIITASFLPGNTLSDSLAERLTMATRLTNEQQALRASIYRWFIERGTAPTVDDLAARLSTPTDVVRQGLGALQDAHALVLDDQAIWMAHPFSGVPTDYRVTTSDGTAYWANCAWDVFGVLALLGVNGTCRPSCPDCGTELELSVVDGSPSSDGVVHFAVPAREFWDDIGYT